MTSFDPTAGGENDEEAGDRPTPGALCRLSARIPGQAELFAVDAASMIIVAAPQLSEPGKIMMQIYTPTPLHFAALVGHALATLRYHHGENGVRSALEMSKLVDVAATDGVVDFPPATPPKPADDGPFGSIGGGRLG